MIKIFLPLNPYLNLICKVPFATKGHIYSVWRLGYRYFGRHHYSAEHSGYFVDFSFSLLKCDMAFSVYHYTPGVFLWGGS
jgi:hypothetical protein